MSPSGKCYGHVRVVEWFIVKFPFLIGVSPSDKSMLELGRFVHLSHQVLLC